MADISKVSTPKARRQSRLAHVAGGLGTDWPRFLTLGAQLQERADYVSGMFREMDAEFNDAGFISDSQEGSAVAGGLSAAYCDLIVMFLTTCLASSLALPSAQRSTTPLLVIDRQRPEKLDLANFDTGARIADFGQCSVPEGGNMFRLAGILFRSGSGYLPLESAWRCGGKHERHGAVMSLGKHMLTACGIAATNNKAAASLLGIDWRQV